MLDEELKQRISLLVDERLDGREEAALAKNIEDDPEAARVYSRYLLVGEAIRSGARLVYDPALVDRVHRSLASEPTILAPRRKRAATDRYVTTALAAALAGVAVLVGETVVKRADFAVDAPGEQTRLAEAPANSLQTYLINHNGTAYLAANGGLLPYLRVVSQGTPSR